MGRPAPDIGRRLPERVVSRSFCGQGLIPRGGRSGIRGRTALPKEQQVEHHVGMARAQPLHGALLAEGEGPDERRTKDLRQPGAHIHHLGIPHDILCTKAAYDQRPRNLTKALKGGGGDLHCSGGQLRCTVRVQDLQGHPLLQLRQTLHYPAVPVKAVQDAVGVHHPPALSQERPLQCLLVDVAPLQRAGDGPAHPLVEHRGRRLVVNLVQAPAHRLCDHPLGHGRGEAVGHAHRDLHGQPHTAHHCP
mmetsp:Transcript_141167/g.246119  ORF Transcript_141167/g.246119 Transcript_141167/m.246119 type:complete len:248 (+) Transcript_141167:51-794(+)